MEHTDNVNPPASVKASWRRRLAADRAAQSETRHADEAAALARATAEIDGGTVCAYVPFGDEPGSLDLLTALRQQGRTVLLPVIPARRGPLDWAEYTDPSSLATGAFPPVLEPTGPRLGAAAVAKADVVLVPALAVDRQGVRLGRGAGHYDRSLVLASGRARFVVVVRDEELVDRLPAEPHDVRMHAALLPGRGVVRLGERDGV
ncbi:5-formyltetrahydrofolate cyclo-ligase [Saccharomonospora piscinae]|uniref:5-formyltetrahydrofolate cyclo-ligase n=1 Tax=Saccharomonospora piscinae TaxID=687388 RepID=A0A1V9A647_SACPI|nr:5-formyltetrahydrofolate cyclo-ligase [Saccharomonospora piscinae]OQO92607.1 5-formyltetrahydrofolate cyclo-ligase [Saccharomonospora piscinae]TLW91678.1 5-formyltetrahydrofolate cyclo-ligase [Saccharomonospora piscinae]